MNARKRKAQNPYFADKKFVPRIKEVFLSVDVDNYYVFSQCIGKKITKITVRTICQD